jgi:NAD+ synthase (glutamine-hydrolysing)
MRIAIAQINPTVGDLAGNAALIVAQIQNAEKTGCDLVIFPELALTGYPPEDLLLKAAFLRETKKYLSQIARSTRKITAIVGFVDSNRRGSFNAAAWIERGRVAAVYHKRCLPNYGVFDEKRYFVPGATALTRVLKGTRVGVTICEDIWALGPHLRDLKKQKPDIVVNISASPFHLGKLRERHASLKPQIRFLNKPFLYCNLVGGQDELVFDGGSFCAAPNGRISAQYPQFQAGLYIVEAAPPGLRAASKSEPDSLPPIEQIHDALVLGLRDYVRKNNFSKVAIGLSGGIDSALVTALAVEALGRENVVGVTMPSRYNVSATVDDAARTAQNLGIRFESIAIEPLRTAFLTTLAPLFGAGAAGLAEENIQARIRGTLLMALSNKFGWLVLTTGNKSETSTGYCTLYGDMAGGFAVIKDVLKTTVYELARFINRRAGRDLIPQTTIDRPPTAELRDNQKDEDSLGSYALLDPVIVDYVERNLSARPVRPAKNADTAYVQRIRGLIDKSEYKRRQAPPGIKITTRAFGRDYRMPITNRFKETN